MTNSCYECGGPISFITDNYGRVIPLCNQCGGSISRSGVSQRPRTKTQFSRIETLCCPTTCPKCKQSVFFVRHNGGSVWFDQLGWPWPKHVCMVNESTSFDVDTRSMSNRIRLGQILASENVAGEEYRYRLIAVGLNDQGICLRIEPHTRLEIDDLVFVEKVGDTICITDFQKVEYNVLNTVAPSAMGIGKSFLTTGKLVRVPYQP